MLNFFEHLGLFFQADGGGAAGGSAAAGSATGGTPADAGQEGQKDNRVADGATIPAEQKQPEQPKKLSFDELLKDADYKAEYSKRVAETVKGRFKDYNSLKDEHEKLSPVLTELAKKKYGLNIAEGQNLDLDQFSKMVLNDDALYEQEATERGISVESLKEIKSAQRKAADLQKQLEIQRQTDAQRQRNFEVAKQIADTKKVYPNLNFENEYSNPEFRKLVDIGVPVQTVYEIVHHKEIIAAGMQYASEKAAQNVSSTIQAQGARPVENGIDTKATAKIGFDPRNMTDEQYKQIREDIARGIKHRF